MKKFFLIFGLSLFYSFHIHGQGFPKIYLSAGISIVDDSYLKSLKPFSIKEQWNFGGFPSTFKLGIDYREQWILEANYSTNTEKKGKLVNGKIINADRDYESYDLQLKYYFGNEKYRLKMLEYVNPFFAVGYGTSTINNISKNNIVYGLGTYIWFFKRKDCNCSYLKKRSKDLDIGLLLQSVGKSNHEESVNSTNPNNHIEHSASIVVKF